MLVSTTGFALMSVAAKICGNYVSVGLMIFVRSLITIGVLAIWMRWQRVPLLGKNDRFLHLRCFFGTVSMVLYYFALKGAPLAETVVLANTVPLYVPIVAFFVIGERPRPMLFVILAVGFAGVFILLGPQIEEFKIHLLAAAGTGLSGAFALVSLQRATSRSNSLTIVFTFAVWTLALSLPISWDNDIESARAAWLPLALLGTFAVGGQVLLTMAMRVSSAAILTIFNYFGVALSFGFSVIFFDRVPQTTSFIGAGFIVAACLLATYFAPRLIRPVT
jgi:drug/metabolite transporter (DMT)-like permease